MVEEQLTFLKRTSKYRIIQKKQKQKKQNNVTKLL